jgi:hypothetical protein
LSIKISEEVENYIPVLRKQLLFSEKEHKWIILRFMVNLSLSISRDFDLEKSDFIPFREYRLEQIVGKGKGGEDYYWQYWKMLEAFGDKKFKDEKAFENSLEFHINRAYHILKTSLSSNSNIYQFMIDEFF